MSLSPLALWTYPLKREGDGTMTCRKCKNSIDDNSNFCKHCGTVQREKCDECGKMEIIGRTVCESIVKQVYTEQSIYIAKNLPHLENYSLIPGGFIGGIVLVLAALGSNGKLPNPTMTPFFAGIIIMFFSIILWVFLEAVLSPRMVKNAQQKFLKENPEYAEILKQTEEDGNE